MATVEMPQLPFGRWLREAREQAGYSQQRAALAIGVSRPLLSKWERSIGRPDIVEFERLVRLYEAEWLKSALREAFDLGRFDNPYLKTFPNNEVFAKSLLAS